MKFPTSTSLVHEYHGKLLLWKAPTFLEDIKFLICLVYDAVSVSQNAHSTMSLPVLLPLDEAHLVAKVPDVVGRFY